MGIFDRLSDNRNIELFPKCGFLLAALTIIGADGDIDEDEINMVAKLARGDERSLDHAIDVFRALDYEECI